MYSNQQPPIYTTQHSIYESQSNSRTNSGLPSDRSRPSYSNHQSPISTTFSNNRSNSGQQQTTTNYVPPNTTRYPSGGNHTRNNSSGTTGGSIEKTNMMSSENPFIDPARPYEKLNTSRTITSITSPAKSTGGINKSLNLSDENPFIDPARPYEKLNTPRTITSITSPAKSTGGVNKSLNLSDENPFHAIYGGYRYPAQIDPTKRITNQNAANRPTENKSLHLSDENPFHSTYERYHSPPQIDTQKRVPELPKPTRPAIPTRELSDDNPFGTYRPSLIRQYSANDNVNGLNSFPTSIADWTRNNPAPLSYRPIQVQRPPPDFYNQNESSNTSSYTPSASLPRQKRQLSSPPPPPPPPPPPARTQSQPQKPISSGPLEKTSLNMSPDNPFAVAYGRYHYPSPNEIKTQKRTNERTTHFPEQSSINTNRITQPTNQMTEQPPETEKKDAISGKGGTKFTRFDVTF